MGKIVFYTDIKITVSRVAPGICVYVSLGIDGVEVRNGKRMDELLVKGKDNILMLIQALDKEQSSHTNNGRGARKSAVSEPSQKACQTRRLELPREGPLEASLFLVLDGLGSRPAR